jgi:hypothetical protein
MMSVPDSVSTEAVPGSPHEVMDTFQAAQLDAKLCLYVAGAHAKMAHGHQKSTWIESKLLPSFTQQVAG